MFSLKTLIYTLAFLGIVACTGQKPAELKSPQTFRQKINESCSKIVWDGKILNKNNLINIFDCTNWKKNYPHLNKTLHEIDENELNVLLSPVNEIFFRTKSQRKKLMDVFAESQKNGEAREVGKILEKLIGERSILAMTSKLMGQPEIGLKEKSKLLKIFSASSKENIKNIESLIRILRILDKNKMNLNKILVVTGSQKNQERLVTVIDEAFDHLEAQDWNNLSKIFFDERNKSSLSNWTKSSLQGDPRILLNILLRPDFMKNIKRLNVAIENGVVCSNDAHSSMFKVDVAGELKQVIDSLKEDEQKRMEEVLLHGLTKYLAFQEFCQERTQKQGLDSFQKVLTYAMALLESEPDYDFIRDLHINFGNDRFKFIDFLTTKSFESILNQLSDLEQEKLSDEFVELMFQTLSSIDASDLQIVSKKLKELSSVDSQETEWLNIARIFWQTKNQDEKKQLLDVFALALDEDVSLVHVFDFFKKIMISFPEASSDLSLNLENEKLLNALTKVLFHFDEEATIKDLSIFLSDEGLFELVRVLTQTEGQPDSESRKVSSIKPIDLTYIEKPEIRTPSQTRICFNQLNASYEINSSYYQLVNELPQSCRSVLGNAGFVGQIYLWMNQSHQDFIDRFGVDDFHSAQSVWSPGMLHFIFTAAVQANLNLSSSEGRRGIAPHIDEIHRVLTDPFLLDLIHDFSLLFGQAHKILNLDQKLNDYVALKNDQELKKITQDIFKILGPVRPSLLLNKNGNCQDLNPRLGVDPCLRGSDQAKNTIELLRLLKRKNEKEQSLIKEILSWLHPKGGVGGQRKLTTSIDEVLTFLFDLSGEKTKKEFIFYEKNSSRKELGTVLDRLEIVIRDISFLNNFYGAFFKNTVAEAQDYKKEINDSRKLLTLMEKSGPLLRGARVFPKITKSKLKNIRSTYSSLAEVADLYPQKNGTYRSYGLFIQGLLSTIQSSSLLRTQDFNPYRVPEESAVDGHNGVFLTNVVQMSGLRHMAYILRDVSNDSLSFLDSNEFKKVNSNLIARHDLKKLQEASQYILDKYLDSPNQELNLIIKDIFYYSSKINPEDESNILEIFTKMMVILSSPEIENEQLYQFASYMEQIIIHWPSLRASIYEMNLETSWIGDLNKLLDQIIANPVAFNSTIKEFSRFINPLEFGNLLHEKDFIIQLTHFLSSSLSLRNINSDLNWFETFKVILANEEMSWEPILNWLAYSKGENLSHKKLSFSLLVKYLGERNESSSRWKSMMDELFLNHRKELQDFIDKTFIYLELKPD